MFITRNITEQKYFADIKLVTGTADLPDRHERFCHRICLFNSEIIHATNSTADKPE